MPDSRRFNRLSARGFARVPARCAASCAALCASLLVAACARDVPRYIAPAERPVAAHEQPWLAGQFLALAYHDIVDTPPTRRDATASHDSATDPARVSTEQLVEQLAWLHENGYQAVSIDQLLAARAGDAPLPERAVLLSFDDGYGSFATRVLPLLRAWNWPALLAPVGVWLDAPEGANISVGGRVVAREQFLDWQQISEIAADGLVEIVARSDRPTYGLPAVDTPQPAASVRAWLAGAGRFETDDEYHDRVADGIAQIAEQLHHATGKLPRVWLWPHGAASGTTLHVIAAAERTLTLALDDGMGLLGEPQASSRVNAAALAEHGPAAIVAAEDAPTLRVVHADLDYVYDPDPEQLQRNLDALTARVTALGVNTVFLQAFADPAADGLVRALYFPNRHLPVRADLFNRAAWQLRNQAQVKVYAWMPVLAFDLDPALPRVLKADTATARAAIDPNQYRRLSPFDATVRQQIGEIYEDLARHAVFDGLLFHDDALLGDFEDASEEAIAASRAAGFGSIASLHRRPERLQAWGRYKTNQLVNFTLDLADKVRAIRGPQIRTARNIYALPVLQPESETWFAQNLDDFLAAYDWVAPMAMPRLENVPPGDENVWLDRLVDAIAARPGALAKTVFELQAREWRRDHPDFGPIDTRTLANWMRRLQRRGARSFGYYPDDFAINHPNPATLRPALSLAWFPYPKDHDQQNPRPEAPQPEAAETRLDAAPENRSGAATE